ncbi:Deoxycytidine monophosphate (dCMP) deaminase [Serendipita sp. 401]|nr:Deoxycytidine monophosphate (dCMP) deaminase [Serendipita sp. 401]KAG8834146.1 Deoxycytidine monophosphate (dCMP) deaminase [Serendipita sp. 400]KAG9056425.1 Deoxycytidine monophosphate (dCMP) deaminase [Serendipita sp. 407]
MFIGLIGTRYSGKTTIIDYLKTRSFTVLQLRGRGANDEDTSTAASSIGDRAAPLETVESNSIIVQVAAGSVAGPSTLHTRAGEPSGITEDRVAGTSGPTPQSEHDSYEWGSRTPETHVHRDVLKEDLVSAFRRSDRKLPVPSSLKFSSPGEMLDYATRNWRSDFVTEDLPTKELLEPFLKRPFFLLVEVDAPLMLRLERAPDMNLRQLVEEHDSLFYGHGKDQIGASHHKLRQMADLTIINSFRTLELFTEYLESLNLMNADRLRPQWDAYFMTLASLASQRSNCMKRRVGAILVRKNRILATGYNGTPRGLTNCNEGGCPRCNGKAKSGEALDECLCLHAEENALLEAGRERIGDGAVLYCNTCPCLRCSVKIVQTGVKEVVYNLGYSMDAAAADVFISSGVVLRQYTPSTDGRRG